MTEITDAEAAEIQWASSEQGKAAVRAAHEKARRLGVDIDLLETGAIIYAAYLAAGWDAEPGEAREHVHDWKVRNSAESISFNPAGGPSVGAAQTVVLLRCAGCGDVASRILAGRWTLVDLRGR